MSQKIEAALAGSGDLTSINKDDLLAWTNDQKAALEAIKAPVDDHPKDALNQRNVVKQARDSVKNPNDKHLADFKPRSSTVKFEDRSAAHALREAIGPLPYRDIKNFGDNYFIPDAYFFSLIVDAVDNIMINTPKFIDAALGYHPLFSRLYCSQLFFLRTFEVMKQQGTLSSENELAYDTFCRSFPLESWPVPGPLVDFLATLSSSHTTEYGMGEISPILPLRVNTENNTWMLTANMAGRVPNVPIITGQLSNYLRTFNAALPAPTAANKQTLTQFYPPAAAAQGSRDSVFLGDLVGLQPFQGAGGAYPTNARSRGTFATAITRAQRENIISPFLVTNPYTSDRAIGAMTSSVPQLNEIVAEMFPQGANTAPAHGTSTTWSDFLLWEYVEFWTLIQPMMALYCRHLSASTTLNTLPPAGHTGAHNVAELLTKMDLGGSTGRYWPTNHDLSFRSVCRILSLPAADSLDFLSCPVNISRIDSTTVSTINRPQGTAPNATLRMGHRLGGPYFYKKFPLRDTDALKPQTAYKSIIAAEYHSQTPLRSTIPDA
jgi:hypothetical protein